MIQSQRTAIPMLPKTVYTQITALPKKLEYEYSLRVMARRNQQLSVDMYDTQKYMLPSRTSTPGIVMDNRGSNVINMDEEESEPLGDEFVDLGGSGVTFGTLSILLNVRSYFLNIFVSLFVCLFG